jgi:hypothetical protein
MGIFWVKVSDLNRDGQLWARLGTIFCQSGLIDAALNPDQFKPSEINHSHGTNLNISQHSF